MKRKPIIMWILTGFFAISALVFMPSFASFVAIAAAIILAPIHTWQELLGKYIGGALKTIIVIVMTIVIAFSAPDTETDDRSDRQDRNAIVESTASTSQPTTIPDDTKATDVEPTDTETVPAETEPVQTEPAPVVTTPPETEPALVVTAPPETEPAPVVTTPPETESAPVVTTPPATEGFSEQMVWIPTKGGQRYHSHSGCSGMEDPAYVTITDAKNAGFTPCGRCY